MLLLTVWYLKFVSLSIILRLCACFVCVCVCVCVCACAHVHMQERERVLWVLSLSCPEMESFEEYFGGQKTNSLNSPLLTSTMCSFS